MRTEEARNAGRRCDDAEAISVARARSCSRCPDAKHQISGLPVVDFRRVLLGIISEVNFLRRAELGKRNALASVAGVAPGDLASEYVQRLPPAR